MSKDSGRRVTTLQRECEKKLEEQGAEHNSRIKQLVREMNAKMATQEHETEQALHEAICECFYFALLLLIEFSLLLLRD